MPARQCVFALLMALPLAGSLCGCPASDQAPKKSALKAPAPGTVLYLHRWVEPQEHAFTILLPQGWIAEGGILRVDPRQGPTNSVGAKVDFTLKKDRAGSFMIHWLPNFTYKDPQALGGMFPVGSNYMGSMVYPLVDPQTYLDQFVFRKQRPLARNVRIAERRPLPELAQRYQQRAAMPNMRYQAGALTIAYDEGGVHYSEKLMAVIEYIAGQGLGMWTNHDTLAVRAPAAEFDRAVPLFSAIESSLKGNPEWAAAENRGSATRARQALETQRYLQEQRRQMVERQRQVNAEARHSSWLFLTGQDDYVNPHTGEVEQGSNQYRRRWVNGNGDVIYSNNPDYDPSWDASLPNRSDYEQSPLRKR